MARVTPPHERGPARPPFKFRLRALWWAVAAAAGRFERLRRIDAARVERLVFVCKGNVCRSPYAEVLARRAGWNAVSVGIATRGGIRANIRARAVARERGVNLFAHRSTCIQDLQLDEHDLLVAMEPSHLKALRPLVAKSGAQWTLLGLWRRRPQSVIHDPFGRERMAFAACFGEVEEGIEGLLAALADEAPAAEGMTGRV